MKNSREKFIKICKEKIHRDGIVSLLEWLENKSDFFTAPASTRFHGNYEGGLLEHSLNVYDLLCQSEMLKYIPNLTEENIAIVALFHDLCKTNFYKIDYRNVKNANGYWDRVPFYTIEDTLPYGHGEKSVYIVSGFMRLTREEAMAIRWHMGAFDDSVKGGSFSLNGAFEQFPLALELHIADTRATYILEKDNSRG